MSSVGVPPDGRGVIPGGVEPAFSEVSLLRLHAAPIGLFINNYLIGEVVGGAGGAEKFCQPSWA